MLRGLVDVQLFDRLENFRKLDDAPVAFDENVSDRLRTLMQVRRDAIMLRLERKDCAAGRTVKSKKSGCTMRYSDNSKVCETSMGARAS